MKTVNNLFFLILLFALSNCAGSKSDESYQTYDADIVIWNTEEEFRIDKSALLHRNKISPYDGELLKGVVQKTFLRGRKIYDEGRLRPQPIGRMLLRPQKGTKSTNTT